MKKYFVYIKGIFLLTLIVFLYAFANKKNEKILLKKNEIQFKDANKLFINEKIVNKLLIQNGATPKKVTKSVIDLHSLESKVRLNPMIANATVYLTVEGVLKTTIKQRTPVARVISKEGGFYIDNHGEFMPLSSIFSKRVLLVSGNIKKKDFKKVATLSKSILNNKLLEELCTGIVKDQNNDFVLITRLGNQKIILGSLEHLPKKLKKLNVFLAKLIKDQSTKKYKVINLKYNNQVVCAKF
ncbi:MAG: cell division protein FtsQ/DivIB [Lutibacter sp.]